MPALLPLLRATPWGKTLADDEIVAAAADTVEKKVAAGAFVCRKGEPVDAWIGVIDGLVKMSSLSPAGKPVTFTGLPTGGWFGEGSLLKHPQTRMYDVVAIRDSRVAYTQAQCHTRLSRFHRVGGSPRR